MISIKTQEDIEILREAGKRLAFVLESVSRCVVAGVSTEKLNSIAEEMIKKNGDIPSFLGYSPDGASRPYPATLCTSINDEVVHGVPNTNPRILKEGDIITIDCGLTHKKRIVDSAITVSVGMIDKKAKELMSVTKRALALGIGAAQAGNTVGDIGYAIEQYVKQSRFGIVRELGGHGVGYEVHEDPHIFNFGKRGTGATLKPGMVLAIEPIITEGGEDIILGDDGFTLKTKDGSRAAHEEHTVVVTDSDAEILTQE